MQTDISGIHIEIDEKLQRYAHRKISNLDKYVSREARKTARAEVRLEESKANELNKASCEVTVHLPKGNVVVKEATVNMYAAIDIAEEKLRHALRKYKERHDQPRMYRRVMKRLSPRDGAA